MIVTNQKSFDNILNGMIRVVTRISEARDLYTAGHQYRVCQLASEIGKHLGFTQKRLNALCVASILHDIGKVNIPVEILSKPGKISSVEFELIKTHVDFGYNILKPIKFTFPVATWVKQHHEREDGSGYPDKLKSSNIQLESAIIGVSDVVEAMVSHRPYRAALGIEAALEEIFKYSGSKYKSEVVDICMDVFANGFEFTEGQLDKTPCGKFVTDKEET